MCLAVIGSYSTLILLDILRSYGANFVLFIKKLIKPLFVLMLIIMLVGGTYAATVYYKLSADLPAIDTLKDIQLQEPLRVYTADGLLISEYGEKRRIPLKSEETPKQLKQAFIAAEDDRYYQHPGVDWQGIARAALVWVSTGSRSQGGSTITMQVARNFFLSPERTIDRKLREMLLALKIDQELSKDDILQLYLNKIYLGKRAYGVAAAARIYYNKTVDELTLAQMAMIAGLPKAPSKYNPIANPTRAMQRRNYVLGRMLDLNMISQEEHAKAVDEPISAKVYVTMPEVEAYHLGEMARTEVERLFPGQIYDSGLKIYTTVDSLQQRAANQAVLNGLLRVDRRHGFRGALKHLDNIASSDGRLNVELADSELGALAKTFELNPALIFKLSADSVDVYLGNNHYGKIDFASMKWARAYINEDKLGAKLQKPADILKVGDIIYTEIDQDGQLQLAQLPSQEAALVSLDPQTGAIKALVGGKDYFTSKFNRATQAKRQSGSSFKPFVYAAAIANGFSPATVINDAPVVFSENAFSGSWKPANYSHKSYGPTRLRNALAYSRNLVSIRLLMQLGIDKATAFLRRIGFADSAVVPDLSLALGSGLVTPLELTKQFALFVNGGYAVTPYFIERIETADGKTLYWQPRQVVCLSCYQQQHPEIFAKDEQNAVDASLIERLPQEKTLTVTQAPQVMDEKVAYIMRTMLADVTSTGTARKAQALKRQDLGGKTGTTNDQMDAWFSGFGGNLVATVWVGHDTLKPMGHKETGTTTALPIWMEFMQSALKNQPDNGLPKPPKGVLSAKIDPQSGLLAYPNQQNALTEFFTSDNIPTERAPDPNTAIGKALEAVSPELDGEELPQDAPAPLF